MLGPLPLCRSLVLAERPSAPAAALVVLVLWLLVQLCVGLVVGVLARMTLGTVLLVEAVTFLGGFALTRRGGALTADRPFGIAGGALAVLALAVLGLSLFLRLATTPITDYDSLAYHLPTIARWYRTHAVVVYADELGRFSRQIARYPFGWEVVCTLFLLPFRDDFLVALPNLIAWAVLGLATSLVAVELGARPRDALLAAFLLLAMPITREHVDTMHVDLPLGALFMAGVYFALASETAETPLFCGLCVATAGMVAAIKTTGLLYGAFLVATLAVSRRRTAETGRGRWRYGVLAAAGVAAGAFWYVRNAIELGNPLGYVRVGIGSFVLPGIIDPAWLRQTSVASVFEPTRGEHWRIMLGAIRRELGLPFLLVVLSAIGLLAGRQRERRRLAIVTALIVLTGVVYCTTPFGGTIAPLPRAQLSAWTGQAFRYAFPLLGVLSAVSALGIATVPASERAVASVPVLLVIAGLTSATLACAVALLAAAVALHRLLRRMDGRRRAAIGSLVLCVAVSVGTRWLRFRRDAERVRAYGGAGGFISAHLGPHDAVASVLSHQSYLFYGKDFRNDVVYLPASPTVDEWLAALRRARVSLVAVGPLRPEWRRRPEVAWLSAPDGQFVRVFGSDPTREPVVYRVPEVPNHEPPRYFAP